MADARRREFERRAGSGDPDAERALLLERLRQGDVSPQALSLAAYLGHPPARAALPDAPPPGPLGDLTTWLEGLSPLGPSLLTRAALAAARVAFPRLDDAPDDARLRLALEAVEAWLDCPCEAHRVAARLAGEAADEAARDLSVAVAVSDEAAFAAFAARNAALTAAALRPVDALQEASNAFLDAGSALDDDLALRQAVRARLLEWALESSPTRP